MTGLERVEIEPAPLERFRPLVGERFAAIERAAAAARETFAGRRRSDLIAEKSLAEGFGLTVAEAMWRSTACANTSSCSPG